MANVISWRCLQERWSTQLNQKEVSLTLLITLNANDDVFMITFYYYLLSLLFFSLILLKAEFNFSLGDQRQIRFSDVFAPLQDEMNDYTNTN